MSKLLRRAAAVLALASTTVLMGAPGLPPGQPDVSRVLAGTYTADAAHTLVEWRVNHMGFSDYFGLFGSITGVLVIDPAHLELAQVTARIPVRKLTTANPGLTGHLLMPGGQDGKPDYFGPKPADATFISTRVKPNADGKSAAIEGKLSLNGVTRPVTIAAEFVGAGKDPIFGAQMIGFRGSTRINRSDFGLVADSPLVSDQVDLTIAAAFRRR